MPVTIPATRCRGARLLSRPDFARSGCASEGGTGSPDSTPANPALLVIFQLHPQAWRQRLLPTPRLGSFHGIHRIAAAVGFRCSVWRLPPDLKVEGVRELCTVLCSIRPVRVVTGDAAHTPLARGCITALALTVRPSGVATLCCRRSTGSPGRRFGGHPRRDGLPVSRGFRPSPGTPLSATRVVVVQTFTRIGFPVRSASAVGIRWPLTAASRAISRTVLLLTTAVRWLVRLQAKPRPRAFASCRGAALGSPQGLRTIHPQIMAPGSTPGQQHTASCLRWVARPRCPLHFLSAPSQPLFAVSKCGPPLSGTSREHRHASGCSALGFHVSAPRLACPSTPAMI